VVFDLLHVIGSDPSRVPAIAFVFGQERSRAAYEDPIGCLCLAAGLRIDSREGPAETRAGLVDAGGIGKVFTAQVLREDAGLYGSRIAAQGE